MDLVQRFLKYVSFDTQSDERSKETPSTAKQLKLAAYLEKELKSIGLSDVVLDQYGIVYATLPSNVDYPCDTIGFIAHMDTSPDASGTNIKPRIINNYDGSDIILNENTIMSVKDFPLLSRNIGEDLIVTDGTTLLGADDKAGIAIIVETCYRLLNNKNIKHGTIKIAFTPDEEVGRGVENFDVDYFNSDYAYTIDGSDIAAINYENFNASSAIVEINGISIHPGSAKGKLVNASLLGKEFDDLLPQNELPELTDNYEGFHHLVHIEGGVEKAILYYIIRNHDDEILKRQEQDFINAQNIINKKYGKELVNVTIKESYKNMKSIIDKHPEVLKRVCDAYDTLDQQYIFMPIRGGTDGAQLSYKGLPCPNLGNGGYNFHGRFEYVSITQMRKMVKILCEIAKIK